MGYHVAMSFDRVAFRADRSSDFWKIIKDLNKKLGLKLSDKIVDEFDEWKYTCTYDKRTDKFQVTEFTGEKLHSFTVDFWKALAPIMDEGGSIECVGEDDERWKWKFVGGKLHEIYGRWIWDDEGSFRIKSIR